MFLCVLSLSCLHTFLMPQVRGPLGSLTWKPLLLDVPFEAYFLYCSLIYTYIHICRYVDIWDLFYLFILCVFLWNVYIQFQSRPEKGIRYLGHELQTVVLCHGDARNWNQVLEKSSHCFYVLSNLSSLHTCSFKSIMLYPSTMKVPMC